MPDDKILVQQKAAVSDVHFEPHHEGDVVLRDGSTVRIRVMRPSDEAGLCALLTSLSEESRWLRFYCLQNSSALASEAHREANLDQAFGLVACGGNEERVVGHAFYVAIGEQRAEVAFTIANDFQGRGLGSILLGQLAEVASANGIKSFEAEVIAANHGMLHVFRASGFPIEVNASAGQLHVVFPTSFTAEARNQFERRESIAAVNALRLFFEPRAVAVIGASRRRGTIGGEIFHNLLSYGFKGAVYAVNPTAADIENIKSYPTVEAISGPVDLAVIVVPAAKVIEVATACARKGVKALVVISAGFSETGKEGKARQAELLNVCRAAGMRLIGPNCMGIANTNPAVLLNATFAPGVPPRGRVGFSSQSGALGLAIMEFANSLGLGISTFVSVGNKADISGNDLLRYWESDDDTDVILLYPESFGAGGVQVELLKDVSVRLTPLSNEDASEMIRELKTYPLLTGFRGSIPCDVAALEEVLLRVSAMVEDIPQIAELDCNPFVVHETGGAILDARIRVTAIEPRPLVGVRR